jgi:hypothetical protein
MDAEGLRLSEARQEVDRLARAISNRSLSVNGERYWASLEDEI